MQHKDVDVNTTANTRLYNQGGGAKILEYLLIWGI